MELNNELANSELAANVTVACTPRNRANLRRLKTTSIQSFQRWEKENELLYAMIEDETGWLSNLFPDQFITAELFFYALEDGTLLCLLANYIQDMANKYSEKTGHPVPGKKFAFNKSKRGTRESRLFHSRDNVEKFLSWCRLHGIPEAILFESNDVVLVDECRTGGREIVICLMEIARRCSSYELTQLPQLIHLEKEIDQEESNDSSSTDYNQPLMVETSSTNFQCDRSPIDSDSGVESVFEEGAEQNSTRLMEFALEDELKDAKHEQKNKSQPKELSSLLENQIPKTELDEKVCKIAKDYNIKIVHRLKEGKYIILGKTMFVRMLNDHLLVRIGGGWDTLEHYIMTHSPKPTTGETPITSPPPSEPPSHKGSGVWSRLVQKVKRRDSSPSLSGSPVVISKKPRPDSSPVTYKLRDRFKKKQQSVEEKDGKDITEAIQKIESLVKTPNLDNSTPFHTTKTFFQLKNRFNRGRTNSRGSLSDIRKSKTMEEFNTEVNGSMKEQGIEDHTLNDNLVKESSEQKPSTDNPTLIEFQDSPVNTSIEGDGSQMSTDVLVPEPATGDLLFGSGQSSEQTTVETFSSSQVTTVESQLISLGDPLQPEQSETQQQSQVNMMMFSETVVSESTHAESTPNEDQGTLNTEQHQVEAPPIHEDTEEKAESTPEDHLLVEAEPQPQAVIEESQKFEPQTDHADEQSAPAEEPCAPEEKEEKDHDEPAVTEQPTEEIKPPEPAPTEVSPNEAELAVHESDMSESAPTPDFLLLDAPADEVAPEVPPPQEQPPLVPQPVEQPVQERSPDGLFAEEQPLEIPSPSEEQPPQVEEKSAEEPSPEEPSPEEPSPEEPSPVEPSPEEPSPEEPSPVEPSPEEQMPEEQLPEKQPAVEQSTEVQQLPAEPQATDVSPPEEHPVQEQLPAGQPMKDQPPEVLASPEEPPQEQVSKQQTNEELPSEVLPPEEKSPATVQHEDEHPTVDKVPDVVPIVAATEAKPASKPGKGVEQPKSAKVPQAAAQKGKTAPTTAKVKPGSATTRTQSKPKPASATTAPAAKKPASTRPQQLGITKPPARKAPGEKATTSPTKPTSTAKRHSPTTTTKTTVTKTSTTTSKPANGSRATPGTKPTEAARKPGATGTKLGAPSARPGTAGKQGTTTTTTRTAARTAPTKPATDSGKPTSATPKPGTTTTRPGSTTKKTTRPPSATTTVANGSRARPSSARPTAGKATDKTDGKAQPAKPNGKPTIGARTTVKQTTVTKSAHDPVSKTTTKTATKTTVKETKAPLNGKAKPGSATAAKPKSGVPGRPKSPTKGSPKKTAPTKPAKASSEPANPDQPSKTTEVTTMEGDGVIKEVSKTTHTEVDDDGCVTTVNEVTTTILTTNKEQQNVSEETTVDESG